MSQRTTKPTVRLARPVKTQISLCITCSLISLLTPTHLGNPKRGTRKLLLYWVDVQAGLSCAGQTGLIVGFDVCCLSRDTRKCQNKKKKKKQKKKHSRSDAQQEDKNKY